MSTNSTFTIRKGCAEIVYIQLRPFENVDDWVVAFRAKSSVVNPPQDASLATFPSALTASFLANDINATTTLVNVTTTRNFPLQGPFKIRVDDEVMQVTDGVGFWSNGQLNTAWTVERGVWGTTPVTHTQRSRVILFTTPQMLLDNGDHGGVTVSNTDTGLFAVEFTATMTNERPVGTYWWNLMRTDTGSERVIAEGVMHLIPSVNSAFDEPPLHNN